MTARPRAATALAAIALATLLAFTGAVQARPLVPAEERDQPYSGNLRACTDPSAMGYIQGQFASREAEYWHSGLTIVGFDDVREIGMRSNGLDYIPRRYCEARAIMSDNKVRPVTYSIEEAGAGIGFGDNVVWCVTGLDRLNAFAPACLSARP